MGQFRYTSDPHFNHPMIAGKRGFSPVTGEDGKVRGDVTEHDGVILENLNKGTKADDITVIAGDFAMNWKGIDKILAQLRSRIILIEGNHDIMSSIHKNGWKHRAKWTGPGLFEAIIPWLPRAAGDREFLVSHYPYKGEGERDIKDRYTQYRLRDEGRWLLHGHTHSKDKITLYPDLECFFCGLTIAGGCICQSPKPPRQIHIGLDAWDLHPVQETDVLDLMNSLDSG